MLSAPIHSVHSSRAAITSTSAISPNDTGSSSSSSSSGKRKSSSTMTTSTKRKRLDTPGDSPTTSKNGSKKKKATRACVHCQKAHLTCDDSRPCQRCVKRGMAHNCVEGHRKKAKYLLDDDELEALKRDKPAGQQSSTPSHDPQPKLEELTPQAEPQLKESTPLPESLPPITTSSLPPPAETFASPASPMFPFTTTTYTSPFDPGSSYGLSPNFTSFGSSFGSEAANLEYSILSAILGTTNSPPEPNTPPADSSSTQQSFTSSSWPSVYTPESSSNANVYDEQTLTDMAGMSSNSGLFSIPTRTTSPSQILKFSAPYSRNASSSFQRGFGSQPGTTTTSPGHSSTSLPPASTSEDDSTTHGSTVLKRKLTIYDTVTKSYDYTEGYHFLMKFLVSRFDKNDTLRVVRALAIFRPSLIAMQMSLVPEDEVFMEKCFQRSLIEIEKLISFSGTPTVAWRRTGEICLVGDEFCLLTGWSKEELLVGGSESGDNQEDTPRKKFIYELFENQSVVEYWENFASHAFESTTQSVFSHCVLLKPNGAPVPCTFCFSIRRDLLDLPNLCVGQWLPLL